MWPLPEGIYHTVAQCARIATTSAFKTISETHFRQESSKITHFNTWLRQKHRLVVSFWLTIPPTWPQCKICPVETLQCRAGNIVEKSLSPLRGLLFLTSLKYFYPAFQSSSSVSPSNDWNQCTGPNFFAALLPYENDAGVCFVLAFPITQWVNFVSCLVSGTAGRQKETELFVRDEMLGCQLL